MARFFNLICALFVLSYVQLDNKYMLNIGREVSIGENCAQSL